MSKEKMSQEKVRPVISHLDLGAIDYPMDADGCRYDPRIRELLKRTGRRVDAGTEALAAVRMLGKKMHLMMERWADQHGLSEGRFQILVRLQHAEGNRMTMGELAEMLEVSPRTVTGLVDNLERHGLVRRVDDPDDRRSVYAELTDPGLPRCLARSAGFDKESCSVRVGSTSGHLFAAHPGNERRGGEDACHKLN